MTHHPLSRRLCLALAALCLSVPALAQNAPASPLQVEGAWVRTSVAGQSGTGAFMRLTAREPLTLVGAQTPVAGVAEVHEMKMDGDVMRMRALASGLELPAGKAVELKPGGYHLMLMDLKTPLRADTRVPLTLVLRDAKGAERRVELQLPVAVRAPGAAPAATGGHMHGPAHKH
jgi:copper(I)-binding protein